MKSSENRYKVRLSNTEDEATSAVIGRREKRC